ncbi:MAG: hypothetical protein QOI03_1475 [Solirubrobacteraceae bacterium]|jgi:ATP-dependent helicase/DNAse subunit B|nr:hypothetical protein [Solirubrobacteraceae bacterium]
MAITLISGPANAGKARLVTDGVRRHLAHGEEPLLIVPTRADGEYHLRELGGDGAILGVRVERFNGLIEEVVRRAGIVGQALGETAREQLLWSIAASHAGRPLERGFARSLGAFVAELQVARVSPARLRAALGQWAAADGSEASAVELGSIFAEYQRKLADISRLDAEQRAVRALDELRRAPALWGRTPVLLYGFDDLTRLQLDAIETLGAVVDAPLTVSLTYEPGRTAFAGRASTFAALAPLAREHRVLDARAEYYAPGARSALSHLERSLFEPPSARADSGAALRLLEGGGERAELELVAGEISQLLDTGVAPEEVAVVMRGSPARWELAEEVFASAGVPYALQRRRPLSDAAIGRALIGLLRCVPRDTVPAASAGWQAAPAEGELSDLLCWLRAPGVLTRVELADSLELSARRIGASSAAVARELWEERNWPLAALDQLAEAERRGATALIDRAARELQWLLAAPRRREAALLDAEELDEVRALAAARRALAELRELAQLAPETAPRSASELAQALEQVRFVSGERAATGAVAVLDPLALRARRVRALFLCCLQEGTFPARARRTPMLAEEERRRLAEVSALSLAEHEDTLAAERYLLYAVLSRPEELLVLSWHTSDDDGEATSRSLFVDDVCDLFQESLGERRARRALGAVAPVGEDRDGAAIANGASTPERAAAGVSRLRDPRLLAGLRERVWSASSLELWIGCPVRWFVERMLRPRTLDPDPEPLARGSLAHAALRDTLERLKQERGSARLTAATLPRARELLAVALEENEKRHPLSVIPERRPGVRRRLRADLERYLAHAALSASELEPRWLELPFGFPAEDDAGEPGLGVLQLGEGLALRGRIDRLDVGEHGEAVVYDYKGRDAPPAAKWLRDGNLQVALYMQAVEQLVGLSAVGGFYQPLAGRDLRARGVLDEDANVALDCVRSDVMASAEVRDLRAEALQAARRAAAQAAAGELEGRPQTCTYQGRCKYPTICRCEP